MRAPMMTIDDIRAAAAVHGYELRKKGVKRDKVNRVTADGKTIHNTYFPHFRIGGSCYARTWKMFKKAQEFWGRTRTEKPAFGDVWEERMLLCCEHILRYLNLDTTEAEMVKAIYRLANPLPKSEYVKRGNKNIKK